MKTATVRDLRNHFADVAKWIEHGEAVTITRNGVAFATLGVCRTEFIVWAMSLASASRAAQWQGGSLAKNARGGLKNGRRSGEEGVFLKETSSFALFCLV